MLRKLSLESKLVSFVLLAELVFVLFTTPVIALYSYQSIRAGFTVEQKSLVNTIRSSASVSIFARNQAIAEEVSSGLLNNDKIIGVKIIGYDNFSHEKAAFGPEADINSLWETAKYYSLYSPLDETSIIGNLIIVSDTDLQSRLMYDEVVGETFLFVIFSLLLCAVVIVAVRFSIGQPLRSLSNQLLKIDADTDRKIEVDKYHQRDEIGLVAHSLNSLLERVSTAIHQERDMRLKIERMDRHFNNIFASTHVGMMVLSSQGKLVHSNPVLLNRMIDISDLAADDFYQADFLDLAFKDSITAWALVKKARQTGETVSADLQLNRQSNETVWVHCVLSTYTNLETGAESIEGILYDVTSRIERENLALSLAEKDSLTGLCNRRGCDAYIHSWMKHAEPSRDLVAILLDLDGFKPINDFHGHAIGDDVLVVIARRLQTCSRSKTDNVCRLGGDEFLVLTEVTPDDNDKIEQLCQRILAECSKPIEISNGKEVAVGASLGVATQFRHYSSFELFLEAADKAMYQVKQRGKGSYQVV